MRRQTSRLAVGSVTAVLVAWLAVGCSAAASEDDPYAARYASALEQATTDFERGVLADHRVTRAEYEEAVQRYVDCLEGYSVDVLPHDTYGYFTYQVEGYSNMAGYEAHSQECAEGTTVLIEWLYTDQLTNPDNLDPLENVLGCLQRKGIVGTDMTREDLRALMSASDGESQPTEPGAVDLSAPEVVACFGNPSNS